MISEATAEAVEAKVNGVISSGAILLAGHDRIGSVYAPTVLENVSHESDIWCEEVFAPVVILQPIQNIDEAIALSNDTDVSLHSGIFTTNLEVALRAAATS